MKIRKNEYGWSTYAGNKQNNLNYYVDVNFPKGKEPEGDYLEGKLIFRDVSGKETECFLSCYAKNNGNVNAKLVMLDKREVQTTLSGDGRDALGHIDQINPDELPFY